MKIINKAVSLTIVFATIALLMAVPTFAETAPNLIYDMEISNGQIVNSVENGENLFAINNKGDGTVGFSSFNGIMGDVDYVVMEDTTSSIKYSTADSDMVGKSYTLEAWIQPERQNNTFVAQPFMSITSDVASSLPNDDLASPTVASPNVAVGFIGTSDSFYEDSGNCNAYIAWHRTGNWEYSTNWMHQDYRTNDWIKVTLVREVVEEDDVATIKKRLYINGTNMINGYTSNYWHEWSYTTTAPFTDELLSFIIGSYKNAYTKCNVADVKLYTGAKDTTQILNDYNNEKTMYKVADIINSAPVDSDIQIATLGITEIEPEATLKDLNTNDIISASCSIDSGVINVSPAKYLKYGTRYLLSFTDPNLESYVVVTKKHPISVGEISLEGSEMSVPVLNSLSSATDIMVMVISDGTNGETPFIMRADLPEITNITAAIASTAKVNVSGANGTDYKILILERVGDLFLPVCMPIEK